jgi:hypothetical protein
MKQADDTEEALTAQATSVIMALWHDVIRAVNTLIKADT